jgi:glycosyltransferase involved in cell wall biosynthesis
LYSGNLYGGIEVGLTTMARLRHLTPGMEPEFGLCFRGRLWEELVATGAVVHDFGQVRLRRPLSVRRARMRLRQVLADRPTDVVVTHDSWPYTIFAPVVRRAGVRLVHSIHGNVNVRHWLDWLASRTPPDLVVANSRFTARSVPALFPAIPIEVWHAPRALPALDASVRFQVRSELGTTESAVVILQASRLERWKGQAAHLAALGILRDVPEWECWIAGGVQKPGEREFLSELKSAAEKAGIAHRVRFLGQRTDIPRLMAAADVFCQPNIGPEPFGFVLVEALHARLPVITSDFGGAPEIVDQTCGVLTKPGDTGAVAAALRCMIEDPSRRRVLGEVGPSRAESICDPSRQLKTVAELLQSVAARGQTIARTGAVPPPSLCVEACHQTTSVPIRDRQRAKSGRMKVLHLYSGNLYGGIETFLATIARLRHLAPDMEPEFALCFRGRLWDELVATGASVHHFGSVRLSRPWTVSRARTRLRQILVERRPEVVVTHDSWPHTVFSPVVRRVGIRLVHFVHGMANGRDWLDRLASRTQPDLVVATSRFTASLVRDFFPRAKVETWHYPVSSFDGGPLLEAMRSEMGTPKGAVVILQASRLEQWKGQSVHLAALGLLRDTPGWECWIAGGVQKAGEAKFLHQLRSAAQQAGIADRVRFLGQRADVSRLMAAADVFCQPNIDPEPFGIVFVEALYAGLPVVTSGFGGAAEIVDHTCGVLTKPGDAAGVAAALRSLIQDAAKRKILGTAGPARAKSLCDPARQLNAVATLLRPLADRECND